MEEEARQFASNIRLMEKDIRGLKLADETFMATCQQVLGSDLPRVYDFGEDGHVHAVGALDTIGRGTKMEDLQKVQIELSQGLEQDVLTPMKQWLFAWSTVQERLKELEVFYSKYSKWIPSKVFQKTEESIRTHKAWMERNEQDVCEWERKNRLN